MISYILINMLISLIALALASRLNGAPAGLKLSIILIALLGWLLPVQNLSIQTGVPSKFVASTYFQVLETMEDTGQGQIPFTLIGTKNEKTNFYWFVGILLLIALFKGSFGWKKIQKQLFQMKKGSFFLSKDDPLRSNIPKNVAIRMIPNSYDASLVGYFKPEVWIGTKHFDSGRFSTMLYHEWIHIEHRDNFLRFFLYFIDCLFWWNPLAQLLTAHARMYSEMRCDRRCQEKDDTYSSTLAGVILLNNKNSIFASGLANHFFHDKKMNMRRIKELERGKVMLKISHLVFLFISFSIGIFIFARPDGTNKVENMSKGIPAVGEEGVTPPQFIHRLKPVFPEQAKEEHISGFVILKAIFGKDGHARNFEVLRGIAEQKYGFEKAAIDAVEKWEYIPGKVNGLPADVYLVMKISFELDNEKRISQDSQTKVYVFKKPGEKGTKTTQQMQPMVQRQNAFVRQPFGLEITLDQEGQVKSYKVKEDLQGLDGLIKKLIEEATPGWKFKFNENTDGWIGNMDFNVDLTEKEWIEAKVPRAFRRIKFEGPVIEGINLKDVLFKEMSAFFAEQVEKSLVFDPEFEELRVTYQFENIKWGQALDIMTGNADLYYRVKGKDLIIGARKFVYGI